MRTRLLVPMLLLLWCGGGTQLAAQSLAASKGSEIARPNLAGFVNTKEADVDADAEAPLTASKRDEIIDRFIARELVEMKAFDRYTPVVETYIQEVKPDAKLGIVPKSDYYFLGQADFTGRLKVHSSINHGKKSSLMWSYVPAGFLQMIFVDRGSFDRAHYKFEYVRQEFQGDVRCYVFDVTPAVKAHGARFLGRVWVEDQDFTIVRINGNYTPAMSFSLRTFDDEYYLHFDS